MSIRVMSAVWERSAHSGSALLLMLAIADFARDDGVAWPSLSTLAGKTRMSDRQIRRLVLACESSGELDVDRSRGRHSHRYRLRVDHLPGQVVRVANPDGRVRVRGSQPGHQRPSTRTSEVANPDTAMSAEPYEPSREPTTPPGSPASDATAILVSSKGRHPIGEGGIRLALAVKAKIDAGRKSWDLPRIAASVWDDLGAPHDLHPRIRLLADYVRVNGYDEDAINFGRIGTLAKRYGKVALLGLDEALAKGLEGAAIYDYATAVCKRAARELDAKQEASA